jgi:hypothetical protein
MRQSGRKSVAGKPVRNLPVQGRMRTMPTQERRGLTMLIHPFLAGVICTILVEFGALIVYAFIVAEREKEEKEQNTK